MTGCQSPQISTNHKMPYKKNARLIPAGRFYLLNSVMIIRLFQRFLLSQELQVLR